MTAAILKALQTERLSHSSRISDIQKRINQIDKEIHLLTKKELVISEHAILRLLERRFGQQEILTKVIEQIKSEIEAKTPPDTKNFKINLGDGLVAIIENNVLVTVK